MLKDLRYAFRQLIKYPAMTSIAVGTLAFGIGATTAVFSVVDTLMLRDLPYYDAGRLVTLWQNNSRDNIPRDDVAPGNYFEWRERNETFEAIAAADPYSVDLTGDGPPEVLYGVRVTEEFFQLLGIAPYRGRLLLAEDFQPGGAKVVVLTHGLWQRRFGGAPDLIGRALTLDGDPYTVVGVLPPEFELGLLPAAGERGVWMPLVLEGWEREVRESAWWNVVARLRPGVSLEQAQADMDRVSATLATEYPATNEGIAAVLETLREHLVRSARPALLLLLGAVGLVLLIACANVANLLLARGTERESEFAVRVAVGAERWRLVRQLLTESTLLGLLAGAAGFFLAFWGVDVIKSLSPGDIHRVDAIAVDLRILGFAVLASTLTPVVFGLAPALHFSRPDLRDALKEGKGSAGVVRQRVRSALIVGETALALTLVIGAGLLIRSFIAIIHVDPGFVKENVLVAQVFAWDGSLAVTKCGDDVDCARQERALLFEQTLERIEALPGVQSAGAVSAAPFLEADIALRSTFTIEDEPAPRPGEEPQTFLTVATPKYFSTVSIPLLKGRGFTSFDRFDSPNVVLINETMSRRYWPTADPVGERIRIGESETVREIVGVVGDVRHESLANDPRPEVFIPHAQSGYGSMTYFVKLVNRAGERLLARPADELWGTSAASLRLDECLSGDTPRLLEATFPGATGRWEVRRGSFRQEGLEHQLLVLTDLSRTLHEEERQAWRRLVRVLSHEINNSLAPIKSMTGSLSNLVRREPPPEDREEDLSRGLDIIGARAEALIRFMQSYARLARLPAPQRASLDVGGWVHRVTGLETRLSVAVEDGPVVTIQADSDQLDQLLINLVGNAADAALETGGGVRVGWQSRNGHVEVWVQDDGPGIADTTNLFVPFFTTKPRGTGIGLVLSRQIAEAHGGTISLQNRNDSHGCTAQLRLPLTG